MSPRRYPRFGDHITVTAYVQSWLGYPSDGTTHASLPRFVQSERRDKDGCPGDWMPSLTWPGYPCGDSDSPLFNFDGVNRRWRRLQLAFPIHGVALRTTTRTDGSYPYDSLHLHPTARHRLVKVALPPGLTGTTALAHPDDIQAGWVQLPQEQAA